MHPRPLYPGSLFSLAGDLSQLHLHLNLRNVSDAPLALRWVELELRRRGEALLRERLEATLLAGRLRAARWIAVVDRQSLAAALRSRGALARSKGDAQLGAGESASLPHQALLLRAGELPDELVVTVATDRGAPAAQSFRVTSFEQRTPLRLPVSGRWWVMQGHRFDEEHAGSGLASQGFAYDLGVIGPGGGTYQGDPLRNSSYWASGRPVLAMADGEVVRVQDGVAENDPVGSRPGWDQVLRRPEDLAGNFVVLRHLAGEHSAYLHLKPGLALRPGDRVRAGQVLGRCGNSGNSLEAHLHAQLMDGPDPMRAAALPARFGDFTVELGHLQLYVRGPRPLPTHLPVEPGRGPTARELNPLPLR